MASNTIPLVQYGELLLVAIQIELSDSVALALREDISRAIASQPTRGLVIDLTGVELMDSYISRVIRDITLMARLMGVETVLSGMQANVAMTMVEMGLGWANMTTAMDLEDAFAMLGAGGRSRVSEAYVLVDDDPNEDRILVD